MKKQVDILRNRHPNWTDEELGVNFLQTERTFTISKTVVTAKSRTLSAEYTLEPQKEIVAVHQPEVQKWTQTKSGLFVRE